MDFKTATVLDSYQEGLLTRDGQSDDEWDEDKFMELLDEDPDAGAYRERRLQELETQMKAAKRHIQDGNGSLISVLDEKQALDITTGNKFCVIHFSHPEFLRCKIMSEKLAILARKHLATKFIQIKVEDAPFLTSRLNIKVLPCVISYVNGKEVQRLVGFEELGNADTFAAETLESRLLICGVVQRSIGVLHTAPKLRFSKPVVDSDSDDY